jgi:hypothetical protein
MWLAKPENLNYHSGAQAVARVRDWQDAHPEYRERQRAKRVPALQDHCPSQVLESTGESGISAHHAVITEISPTSALQDLIGAQPLVFVGLIAHFFNITLQDDIANTARSLQKLGEDIANGRGVHGIGYAGDLPRAPATGAPAL